MAQDRQATRRAFNFGIYSSSLAKPELIRSAGGWRAIRAAYKAGIRLTSDERILGSSSFVEKTLASAGEDYDRRMRLKASGIDLEVVMDVSPPILESTRQNCPGLLADSRSVRRVH